MSLKVDKRRREILNIVNNEARAYIGEMATLFEVTKETIRTDFDYLADNYGLLRIHGGVKKDQQEIYNRSYQYQEKKLINVEEKKRICYKAVDILEDGDYIYVDAGSTVSYLLNFLNRKKEITLVTPSIALLMKYVMDGYEHIFRENNHKLIFAGGQINSNILTTFGPFFDRSIEDFNFDKMIFSVDAVDINGGISNSDEVSYDIIKKVAKNSYKKILLADESKFELIANYRVLDWKRLDYIITDKSFQKDWINHIEKLGIQYIKA
ncbi:DeoR/GlpR family DNA-binding transcription regulator [Clostridium sp. DL1XJH146]